MDANNQCLEGELERVSAANCSAHFAVNVNSIRPLWNTTRNHIRRRMYLLLACRATPPPSRSAYHRVLYSRYLLIAVKAICTHPMRWSRSTALWLQNISERTPSDRLKVVALLLSIP